MDLNAFFRDKFAVKPVSDIGWRLMNDTSGIEWANCIMVREKMFNPVRIAGVWGAIYRGRRWPLRGSLFSRLGCLMPSACRPSASGFDCTSTAP